MKQKAPGKNLLLIVGILFVLYGLFMIAAGAISLSAGQQLAAGTMDETAKQIYEMQGITADMLKESAAPAALSGVLFFAAGVIGIVFCNKVKRANLCFIAGIVLLVEVLAEAAYNAVTVGFGMIDMLNVVLGLVAPLLYFWGALKNRQAMQAEKVSA